MSVRHLGGDRYKIDIRQGKKKRYYKNIRAKSDLEAALMEQEYRKLLGRQVGKDYLIEQISERYLEYVQIHLAPKTYRDKFRMLNVAILPFFGRLMPDAITPVLLADFEKHRIEKIGMKKREINLEKLCLSSMIKWAMGQGLCNNPLPKTKPLPYKRPNPEYLTKEELMSIINNMKLRDRALFMCLYVAGLRSSEARNLRWRDVNFQASFLDIIGKGDKQRFVPMAKSLADVLALWKQECLSSDYCFLSRVKQRDGKELSGVLTDIRKPLWTAMEKTGIKRRITPHMFRHAFATYLLENGADIRTIQKMMGHEELTTTSIYMNVVLGQMAKTVDVFDK